MKKQKLLLVLGAVSCVALTSCGQTEITASEAKEIARSASAFETSDYKSLKVSTKITKFDVSGGSAAIYKDVLAKLLNGGKSFEIGKASTETYEYNSFTYSGYIITKESIDEVGKDSTVKYYKDGKKLSVSMTVSAEQSIGSVGSFKIKTEAKNNYDENGYLINGSANIDATLIDNSTCSLGVETSVEWVK